MDCNVQKALETIEEDSFNQNTFFSTKDREAPEKVIIDLNAETVTFKPPDPMEAVKEEIFHPNVSICAPNTQRFIRHMSCFQFLGDQEQKQEKWIRKLLMYRQKYMSE